MEPGPQSQRVSIDTQLVDQHEVAELWRRRVQVRQARSVVRVRLGPGDDRSGAIPSCGE